MFEVSIQNEAEEELNAAALFYEVRKAGLGESFLDQVAACFRLIQEYPLIGRVLFGEFRRCSIQQFPYGVVYRIEGQKVFVLAIAHSSRRPRYWLGRK